MGVQKFPLVVELEPLFAQGGKRFERLPNEPEAQLFVGDYSADEQLNGFLRHGP